VTVRDLSGPSLTASGAGLIVVKGPVTFATAGTLLDTGRTMFAGQPVVTVNLHEVTNVDSAGLALLLEWLRQARAERRAVLFQGVPDKLFAIARLSGVEALLTNGYSPGGSVPSASSGPASAGSGSSSPDSSR
jgi:phospholipid transport system transporter-binding protein